MYVCPKWWQSTQMCQNWHVNVKNDRWWRMTGSWDVIFFMSMLSMIVLIPFAHFFEESVGFGDQVSILQLYNHLTYVRKGEEKSRKIPGGKISQEDFRSFFHIIFIYFNIIWDSICGELCPFFTYVRLYTKFHWKFVAVRVFLGRRWDELRFICIFINFDVRKYYFYKWVFIFCFFFILNQNLICKISEKTDISKIFSNYVYIRFWISILHAEFLSTKKFKKYHDEIQLIKILLIYNVVVCTPLGFTTLTRRGFALYTPFTSPESIINRKEALVMQQQHLVIMMSNMGEKFHRNFIEISCTIVSVQISLLHAKNFREKLNWFSRKFKKYQHKKIEKVFENSEKTREIQTLFSWILTDTDDENSEKMSQELKTINLQIEDATKATVRGPIFWNTVSLFLAAVNIFFPTVIVLQVFLYVAKVKFPRNFWLDSQKWKEKNIERKKQENSLKFHRVFCGKSSHIISLKSKQ